MKLLPQHALGLLLFLAVNASAQWAWVDAAGRKVYSDRPPPSSVMDKQIIQRPGQAQTTAVDKKSAADSASPEARKPPIPAAPTELDKQVQAKEKKAKEEADAKAKAEEQRIQAAQAEQCKRAQASQRALSSGVRFSQVNERGESEIMDDAARAKEAQRLQGIMEQSCR